MEPNQDLAAIRRVRAGDPDAFEALVAAHSRAVHRICWRIVGESAAAEDAAQETFLRAYRFLDRFDDRAEFSTWLHRIAEEDAAAPEFASAEPAPDRRAIASELARAAQVALRALSPDERTAFVLRHYEGRSIAEIGAALGKRENATKQSIFRAVRKLRRALAPLLEQPHEAIP